MIRTRVGYAGGTMDNPSYYRLGDHTETVQIDYDPEQVTYEELLDVFWQSHNCAIEPWSRQYMSIIFYHNDEQERLAVETKEREETLRGERIYTEIVAASDFYPAEGYHQKYYLRNEAQLMREFEMIYPDESDFIASTAAARINGYLGGSGTTTQLEEELDSLGLSPSAAEQLRSIVSARQP